jgi:hypothetical protein
LRDSRTSTAKSKERQAIMATRTTLKITNRSGAEVKVYLTLGAVAGCVHHLNAIPLVTDPVTRL